MLRILVAISCLACAAYFVLGACAAPVSSLRPLLPPSAEPPRVDAGLGISVGGQ